jgi:hypothetical protein
MYLNFVSVFDGQYLEGERRLENVYSNVFFLVKCLNVLLFGLVGSEVRIYRTLLGPAWSKMNETKFVTNFHEDEPFLRSRQNSLFTMTLHWPIP